MTSALFCLHYPGARVGFPGTGGITQRLSGFVGQTSLNDLNGSAKVSLLGQKVLPELDVTVSFDSCPGATAPSPAEFSCKVISASNAGTPVAPETVDCAPITPTM